MKPFPSLIVLATILVCLTGCGTISNIVPKQAPQKPNLANIKTTLGEYSEAFYAEDINRLMKTFDRDAPDYLRAKSVFLKAFRALDLKGNLDAVSLIGTSGKYTFVRLKQKFSATVPSPLTGGQKRTVGAQQDLVLALVTSDKGYKIWRVIFLKALEPETLK